MPSLKKLLLLVTLPLYVLDQWTKWWIVGKFPEPPPGYHSVEEHQAVVEGWFNLVRVHNQGVAFGMGNGSDWAPVVFLCVPLLAMLVIRIFWKKGVFATGLARVAVALLLCGIWGNLTDRLTQGFALESLKGDSFWHRLSAGYVVDFISVKLPYFEKLSPSSGGWWPSFNVADSCICVAATLLFISGLREEKKAKQAEASA
ncbi:signal peptidase II [Luteolibacter sp. LG18]|uniref:signal peptidase II n=1 Tax=Luteolibacter sp. LG18 TaxID=2819286 RepID=UPI002B2E8FEB|nr:lipoprotein signal peptidase [Luteolibacter sp. LG18]